MTTEGGCFCGAVRYRIAGPPRRVTHCHCIHCRRTSGAPFVTWAEIDAGAFTLTEGTPGKFSSRPGVTRQFCTRCGTPLTYRHEDDPGTVDVTVGSLDEPDLFPPDDHVWCDREVAWLKMADDLPRYGLDRSGRPS